MDTPDQARGLIETPQAVAILRGGGCVAFATETVYGLGADAFNTDAVERVFAMKGRPARNPVIVHVDSADMARGVVRDWNDRAALLAERFWPGPLTLILDKAGTVPDVVTAGGPTVGVRCPDHESARLLISEFGGPLVGPSANRSGGVSPTAAKHVLDSFGGQVAVVDGGLCRVGIESTVLDISGGTPRVLRSGDILASQLSDVLSEEVLTPHPDHPDTGPLASPGLMRKHYAPDSPVRLFEPAEWPGVAGDYGVSGRIVLITHNRGRFAPPPNVTYHLPEDASEYARVLYATLRSADAFEAGTILIERVPDGEGWDAVRDRLARASSEG